MARNPFPDADTLWREIVALYETEGIPARCLRLQDSYGLSVVALLLGITLARRGIAIHDAAGKDLTPLLAGWQGNVLLPLRHARRHLKDLDADLYETAKGFELAIESRLLSELVNLLRGRAIWNADDAVTRNIDVIVSAHGELPDAAFDAADNLARRLLPPA